MKTVPLDLRERALIELFNSKADGHCVKSKIYTMQRVYIIELFAGTHSVSNAISRSRIGRDFDVDVLSVDLDPKFEPSICADINIWQYRKSIDEFLRFRRNKDMVVVHASPPCTEFSTALTTRPRNLVAGSKNVKRALKIIAYVEPDFWFLENPSTGLLKDQPFMQKLAKFKNETCYCKWGFLYKKPTNIWSNVELDLPMCTSQTPCTIRRKFGRHLVTSQGGPCQQTVGMGRRTKVYGLPSKLVRHLFEAGIDASAK